MNYRTTNSYCEVLSFVLYAWVACNFFGRKFRRHTSITTTITISISKDQIYSTCGCDQMRFTLSTKLHT
jgi:hypothetical protein